jgi:tetratricopeptide (TPR) repeat protein
LQASRAQALYIAGQLTQAEALGRRCVEGFLRLRRIGQLPPDFRDALDVVASCSLDQGRLQDVDAEYARAVLASPDDPSLRHRLALSLAWAGDRDGYNHAASETIGRFARSTDWLVHEAARACCIVPGGLDDYSTALALARAQVARHPKDPWTHYILGLVCYRSGMFEEAIRRLEDSMRIDPRWPPFLNWPVLAMAHRRLGHREEARRWLARCHPPRAESGPGPPMGESFPIGGLWWDRAEFILLRREADSMILDEGFPAVPFAR